MPSANPTLVLDIGNTRLKWAYVADGKLADHAEAAYTVAKIPGILSKRWNTSRPPRQVLISNVGKAGVADAISLWTIENWALHAEYVSVEHEACGVTCAYRDWASLGPDRWMALIGARKKYKGPVCVVDCGTALTVDALAPDGKHLGGVIVPGIDLMRRALSRGTERIGNVTGHNATPPSAAQNTWLGRSTQECVMAGTLWAAVAFIDRVVADLETELHQRVKCILTGGSAPAVYPLLACDGIREPDLVLQGLAVAAGNPD